MKFTERNVLIGIVGISTAMLICTAQEHNETNKTYISAEKAVAGITLNNINTDISSNDENLDSVFASISEYSSPNYSSVDISSYDINMDTVTATTKNLGYVPAKVSTDSQIFTDSNVIAAAANTKSDKSDSNVVDDIDSYIEYSNFTDVGIANVDSYLNIRKQPGTDKEIVGKMPPKGGCKILSIKDGWAKIKSGDVKGYVKAEYLLTGMDAIDKVKDYGRLVIIVDCDSLRVREKASTKSSILTSIAHGEQLEVLSSTKNWVKVEINNYKGYVAREYVKFSFELLQASKIEVETADGTSIVNGNSGSASADNDSISAGSSSIRSSLVAKASQYLGNRYVYGGNSLTNGIDCSGFTQQIFAMYGISLPRTSRLQATVGTAISSSSAQAGDLVFYGSSSGISHVAICIGGGKIIHASNPRSGIKISNMYYTTPAKVVRVIK